jgi:hypothetical protein
MAWRACVGYGMDGALSFEKRRWLEYQVRYDGNPRNELPATFLMSLFCLSSAHWV